MGKNNKKKKGTDITHIIFAKDDENDQGPNYERSEQRWDNDNRDYSRGRGRDYGGRGRGYGGRGRGYGGRGRGYGGRGRGYGRYDNDHDYNHNGDYGRGYNRNGSYDNDRSYDRGNGRGSGRGRSRGRSRGGYNNRHRYTHDQEHNNDNGSGWGNKTHEVEEDNSRWGRGNKFGSNEESINDTNDTNNTNDTNETKYIQFYNRNLNYDEQKLRDYLYHYLKDRIETEIEENKHPTWDGRITFNIKEEDVINSVFDGDNRVNVYKMLNRKFGSRGYNPITSSVYKAMNGFSPFDVLDDKKKPETYSGYRVANVKIRLSQFSQYVWNLQVLLREGSTSSTTNN